MILIKLLKTRSIRSFLRTLKLPYDLNRHLTNIVFSEPFGSGWELRIMILIFIRIYHASKAEMECIRLEFF